MKKIIMLTLILPLPLYGLITAMDDVQRKLENKKIRRILRDKKKYAFALELAIKQDPHISKIKRNAEDSLVSYDPKNHLITIYDDVGEALHRCHKDFIQLMKEESSDEEVTDTLEHSNRNDGPAGETEHFIKNENKSKKCCCILN